jgi:transcription initiation factor TFIIE subunit alpha
LKAKDWQPTLQDPLVQEYIRERVGEEGLPIAQFIADKEPVQGVEILETIKDKPSNIRKILYRLEDARVAEYQKDTDKTGWETFIWHLTLNEVKYQINRERQRILKDLRNQVQLEKENSFYMCKDGHQRTIFEEAVGLEFKCPECGEQMNFVDNKERVKELEKAISDLEKLVFD